MAARRLVLLLAAAVAVAAAAALAYGHYGRGGGGCGSEVLARLKGLPPLAAAPKGLIVLNGSMYYLYDPASGEAVRLPLEPGSILLSVVDPAGLGPVLFLCSGSALRAYRLELAGGSARLTPLRLPGGLGCNVTGPFWAGGAAVAALRDGRLVLLDLSRGRVETPGFEAHVAAGGRDYRLYDALVHSGRVYLLYLSPGSSGAGLLLRVYEDGRLVSQEALSIEGFVYRAGFAASSRSVYVYAVVDAGGKAVVKLYRVDEGKLVEACSFDTGHLVASPLGFNFGDTDGDGKPDIVVAATDSIEATSDTVYTVLRLEPG